MNPILSKIPSPRESTKASFAITVLVTAILIPVLLIAWVCSLIYRPRA